MGFRVQLSPRSLVVELTGWDLAANLRRRVEVDIARIRDVSVAPRSDVERLIDHRVLGIGTHMGEKRPNKRRVGTMLGRGVSGKQFWAVPSSQGPEPLVVVDLSEEGSYRRIVLAVGDPDDFAAALGAAGET